MTRHSKPETPPTRTSHTPPMIRTATAALLLAVTLTGCTSDEDKKEAGAFCARYMGLDEYANPEGFDRCVDDVVPVLDCLDASKSSLSSWTPENCDDGGYVPLVP